MLGYFPDSVLVDRWRSYSAPHMAPPAAGGRPPCAAASAHPVRRSRAAWPRRSSVPEAPRWRPSVPYLPVSSEPTEWRSSGPTPELSHAADRRARTTLSTAEPDRKNPRFLGYSASNRQGIVSVTVVALPPPRTKRGSARLARASREPALSLVPWHPRNGIAGKWGWRRGGFHGNDESE
jgi:hypothetical protein